MKRGITVGSLVVFCIATSIMSQPTLLTDPANTPLLSISPADAAHRCPPNAKARIDEINHTLMVSRLTQDAYNQLQAELLHLTTYCLPGNNQAPPQNTPQIPPSFTPSSPVPPASVINLPNHAPADWNAEDEKLWQQLTEEISQITHQTSLKLQNLNSKVQELKHRRNNRKGKSRRN